MAIFGIPVVVIPVPIVDTGAAGCTSLTVFGTGCDDTGPPSKSVKSLPNPPSISPIVGAGVTSTKNSGKRYK